MSASASSPASGVETKAAGAGGTVDDRGPLSVDLAHARWRKCLAMLVFGALGVGALTALVGSARIVVGGALVLFALFEARAFVLTILRPAGTSRLDTDAISLPRGLCAGARVTVPLAEVRHAYLLKRALPLAVPGPVLMIETARGTFNYRRDWFAVESEQRRLAAALNRRLGHL